MKEKLAQFVQGRFTINYLFIYLFCILCILDFSGTLYNLVSKGDPAEFYGWVFGRPNYGPGEGFGRRFFWMHMTGIPLSCYVIFARVLPLYKSILLAIFCMCISAVPVIVYVTIVSENEGFSAPINWANYLSAILSLICYIHIIASLILCKLSKNHKRIYW